MTYLQLVNGVLRRLRENEVTTWDESRYSTMVGDFVNDAKRIVEGRWNWSANRSEIVVTTADATDTYALTGFGQDGKVLSAYNDTSNALLIKKPQAWFDRQNAVQNKPSGAPNYYCFRGVDASDDTQIEVWPTPNGVYSLDFYVATYQADLTADSDVLNIPTLPVLHLAVAMLAEEKGEAVGLSSARYFQMADKFLSDAIMFDSTKNSEELEWVQV